MSLATDSIFITALQSNTELMERIGYVAPTSEEDPGQPARLYGTAIPLPDEDADNVPAPYLIVVFDGLQNDQGTKDDRYESEYDTVQIAVQVVGRNINELHELTQTVRDTILSYMLTTQTAIQDFNFSASEIIYNGQKPCYWQELNYQCDVINTNDDEQEE